MSTHHVFILTSEWQDEPSGHRIIVYGRCPQIGAVELIFDQVPPVFFVDRNEKLPSLDFPIKERRPLPLTDFSGKSVDAFYFRSQREHRQASDRYKATGVRFFEGDIRPDERFLMERFIHGQVCIQGEGDQQDRVMRFTNPKIKATSAEFTPVVASIDIETGVASGQLYSIAGHISGGAEEHSRVFMLADRREDMPENLSLYPSEKALLVAFCDWFRACDPDLIIGWHVIGFDLMFLERKCDTFGIPLALARSDRKVVLTDKPGAGYFATISGRVVIDGPPAMRLLGFTFPNYKLETVAQELLDTGKLIKQDHEEKIAEIDRQFREDKPALARYNLEDCVLVTRIFEKANVIPQMVAWSQVTGQQLGALGIHNAVLDRIVLPRLHRKKMVAPNQDDSAAKVKAKHDQPAFAQPGIYPHAVILDFQALYATLLTAFCIDPLALARRDDTPIQTPTGQTFSKQHHILPEYVEQILSNMNQCEPGSVQRGAFERLIEQLCTALMSGKSRFANQDLVDAFEGGRDWLLRESRAYLEKQGFKPVYGDAQTLLIGLREDAASEAQGRELTRALNTHCQRLMMDQFGVQSPTIFQFGSFVDCLIVADPSLNAVQSSKHFCTYRAHPERAQIGYHGLELQGSDWTPLAKTFQEQLLETFFKGHDLDGFVRDFATQLRDGEFNGDLFYRKRLRWDIHAYGKNPPPHVRAARLLTGSTRDVSYVFTKRGPVPIQLEHADVDVQHYLDKQLQPVADVLLTLLGKSFTSISEPKQFELF